MRAFEFIQELMKAAQQIYGTRLKYRLVATECASGLSTVLNRQQHTQYPWLTPQQTLQITGLDLM